MNNLTPSDVRNHPFSICMLHLIQLQPLLARMRSSIAYATAAVFELFELVSSRGTLVQENCIGSYISTMGMDINGSLLPKYYTVTCIPDL